MENQKGYHRGKGELFQNLRVLDFRGIVRKHHGEERLFRAARGFILEKITASHFIAAHALEASALPDWLGGLSEIHP